MLITRYLLWMGIEPATSNLAVRIIKYALTRQSITNDEATGGR